MKINADNFDANRFYEVTDIPVGTTWYEEPGHLYCVLGAIVQPSNNYGRFKIIKRSPTGYLTVSKKGEDGIFLGDDITLRPLNKKDQVKLQRKRDQFCGN